MKHSEEKIEKNFDTLDKFVLILVFIIGLFMITIGLSVDNGGIYNINDQSCTKIGKE